MRVRNLGSLFLFIWLCTGCFIKESDLLHCEFVRYEARTWIIDNPNLYPLAGNRFETKQEALDFVEQLYSAGAETVYVTSVCSEDWRIREEGGPYADRLIVILPNDPQKRRDIFQINTKEAQNEGLVPEVDTGQYELLFWWD
jgi:hypothetical protein